MEDTHILILFSIIILLIVFVLCKKCVENFQRMNYIQLHNYLERKQHVADKYNSNPNPYRHTIHHDVHEPTTSLTGRSSYSSDPYVNIYNGYSGYNADRLIGYLQSEDTDNNDIYELYEVYDYRRGRPGYAYRDTKSPSNRDSILVNIDFKQYSGDYLNDGDVVNITYRKVPFVVKLYKIKQTGLETRYHERDYRSGMHEYALLEPVNPLVDVDEEDRYFIMYEQEIDPRRSLNNYYIKDRRGIIVELSDRSTKFYDGDTILIPGKEKYGEYAVKELDKY